MKNQMTHAPLTEQALEAVASRFRLLGATSRLRILNAVLDGPLSMTALQDCTGLEQSNLSRRVSELEAGGCLRRRREGRQVIVEVSDETFRELCSLVCSSLREHFEQAGSAFEARSVNG